MHVQPQVLGQMLLPKHQEPESACYCVLAVIATLPQNAWGAGSSLAFMNKFWS